MIGKPLGISDANVLSKRIKPTLEGLKTKDIFRCLKRFVAREAYRHLTSVPGPSPTGVS